jgi:hypothetical protein
VGFSGYRHVKENAAGNLSKKNIAKKIAKVQINQMGYFACQSDQRIFPY